jgi:hypothetical protein
MSSSPLVRMTDRSWSNQLKTLERVKGIEPSSSAWKAAAPLAVSTSIPTNGPVFAFRGQKGFRLSERRFRRSCRHSPEDDPECAPANYPRYSKKPEAISRRQHHPERGELSVAVGEG